MQYYVIVFYLQFLKKFKNKLKIPNPLYEIPNKNMNGLLTNL